MCVYLDELICIVSIVDKDKIIYLLALSKNFGVPVDNHGSLKNLVL